MSQEQSDKPHADDGHGNALGTVYDLRCSGSMKYHDYVTVESYEAMKRRAEHAYPYPEAEDWTVEELAAAYRERLKDIEQYRQWVERLQTTPSAIGQKAKEYAGHGLTPEMVKAHYPQTQHQPDECQICAETFEVAAEALALAQGKP